MQQENKQFHIKMKEEARRLLFVWYANIPGGDTRVSSETQFTVAILVSPFFEYFNFSDILYLTNTKHRSYLQKALSQWWLHIVVLRDAEWMNQNNVSARFGNDFNYKDGFRVSNRKHLPTRGKGFRI
jgi:hypothetical protein